MIARAYEERDHIFYSQVKMFALMQVSTCGGRESAMDGAGDGGAARERRKQRPWRPGGSYSARRQPILVELVVCVREAAEYSSAELVRWRRMASMYDVGTFSVGSAGMAP